MKTILAVFCASICLYVSGQKNGSASLRMQPPKNVVQKRLDSLRVLLSGTGWAISKAKQNKILARSPFKKQATTSSTDPCGYFCFISCPATPTWTGNADSNWYNIYNWCTGHVPLPDDDVVISASAFIFPNISADSVRVHDITIDSGAHLKISATGAIKISGTLTASSPVNAIDGTVIYNGTLLQNISANTYSGNSVKNLTITNPQGVSLAGPLFVSGRLTTTGNFVLPASLIIQ